ncbi:MAG: glycosyltransferase [Planctomycetes bacterium]|nr:glycosyltransferase [Planctomycetota bacterium]
MRVGIDYLAAASHGPGTGRYARELVRALVRLPERPELRLFDVGRADRALEARALGLPAGDPGVRRVTRALPRRALPFLARCGLDAARILGGVDLFHHVHVAGPPVRGARQVLALGEFPAPGTADQAALRARCSRMDALLVFCTAARQRAARELDFSPARIHVTPAGAEHWRRELGGLPAPDDPPRLLVLGATRAERAPLAIWRAFERLCVQGLDARLVFAGRDGGAEPELASALRASPHAWRVARIREPAERDLPGLVARSSALVHLDPGAVTAVTPLEALALGVPVVASRSACFEEFLDGVAELVDDEQAARVPSELAEVTARALARRGDPGALAARTARAAQFSWERCARATCAAWRAALGA